MPSNASSDHITILQLGNYKYARNESLQWCKISSARTVICLQLLLLTFYVCYVLSRRQKAINVCDTIA